MRASLVLALGFLLVCAAFTLYVITNDLTLDDLAADVQVVSDFLDSFWSVEYSLPSPYDLVFETPRGWQLVEEDRWTNYINQTCATYSLRSPDTRMVIYIIPFCGEGSEMAGSCPPDTYIAYSLDDEHQIARTFQADKNRYHYLTASVGKAWYNDEPPELLCFTKLFYDKPYDVEAQYFGSEANRDAAMETADKIIQTFR